MREGAMMEETSSWSFGMNISGLKKILSDYAIYFNVERQPISRAGNPPFAHDRFILFVSDAPVGSVRRNVLRLLDSRDLATSINQQGEEDLFNIIFLSLTLAGYEVFVNGILYSPDQPYARYIELPESY
jgi:hypothetical protein